MELYSTKYHSVDISQYKFLITGGAGFIGSNIAEYLIKHKAGHVTVLDNLSNGYFENPYPNYLNQYYGFKNRYDFHNDNRNPASASGQSIYSPSRVNNQSTYTPTGGGYFPPSEMYKQNNNN